MKKAGIDSLLLTSDENFHYFTGGAGMTHMRSNTRPNIVVIPASGEPIAITGAAFTYVVELAGLVKDIRTYNSISGVPSNVLAKALKDCGLKNKKVSVEKGLEQRLNIPLNDYEDLTKSLPSVEFADGSDVIWAVRMIKSKEEVDLMSKACDITGRARQKTFREIKLGMSEREISRMFSRHMLEEGADRICFTHVSAGIPPNHTYLYLERTLKPGDVLYLDGGAYVQTYTCDYSRIAVAGKPTAEQERVHAGVRKANKKMIETLRPGVTCAEVFKAGAKILAEEGLGESQLEGAGRMGHGQGILLTEPPSVSPLDKTVLKPGMVLSTEPGAERAEGEFTWEDVHVITEDGSIQLTKESEEFFRI